MTLVKHVQAPQCFIGAVRLCCKKLWVFVGCLGFLAGSLRGVFGGPRRWPERNWKEWTFYFQSKNFKCVTDVFRKENDPARPRQRSRKSSARKPQRNNKEASRKLHSQKYPQEKKQARHRSHKCPRHATITGGVHFTNVVKVGTVRFETTTATTDAGCASERQLDPGDVER